MKIDGAAPTNAASAARRARPAGTGAFTVPSAGATSAPVATGGVARATSLAGIDALIALQQSEDVTERRKRATKRASGLLDVLDELRVGLLSGGTPANAAQRLTALINEHRDSVDDERLTELLNDIDVRAQVELAKLERAS